VLWALFVTGLVIAFWPRLSRLVYPITPSKIIYDQQQAPRHWIRHLDPTNTTILLTVVLIGLGGLAWLGNRAYFGKPYWWSAPIPKPSDRSWPRYIAKKHSIETPNELTVFDLFELDADATHGATYSSIDTLIDANGRSIWVRKAEHLDMDHGSKSVAFYVPYWEDTYGVEVAMADRVKPFLDLWAGFVLTTKDSGDSDVLSSKDVPFSNRVYFYSEKELTAEEIGKLAGVYKEKGMQIFPRSQSYLSVQKLKLENEQDHVSR
jgi:hypothetical protein